MHEGLSARQALLIWRLLTAETEAERAPMKSKARPDIGKQQRDELVARGYLETEQRGRAQHLCLTDKAWVWAAAARDVELMQSKEAARAFEGLLRRLVPFLEQREIPLADLFREPTRTDAPAAAPRVAAQELGTLAARIEAACLALAKGRRKQRVRLAELRARLEDVPRESLDHELVQLQRSGRLVLYRDDHTSALSSADHAAALTVGDSPRHIVYLEG